MTVLTSAGGPISMLHYSYRQGWDLISPSLFALLNAFLLVPYYRKQNRRTLILFTIGALLWFLQGFSVAYVWI